MLARACLPKSLAFVPSAVFREEILVCVSVKQALQKSEWLVGELL